MSYTVYKFLHILSIVLVSGALSLVFLADFNKKWVKITSGTISFLILVTGMGLLARLGMNDHHAWPLWVKAKLGIWLLLAVGGPVLAKRFPQYRIYAYIGLMTLMTIAIFLVVNKIG